MHFQASSSNLQVPDAATAAADQGPVQPAPIVSGRDGAVRAGWGIPNTLNDVLIRQFMKSFAIFEAGLVQSAFYVLLAMLAAILMDRLGYKAWFVAGLLLFSLGTFRFWQGAIVGRYGLFLFALFLIASGLSFVETASNPRFLKKHEQKP